ncbi:MAG: peptide deformylase [candidate division WOR-3 bacterium]
MFPVGRVLSVITIQDKLSLTVLRTAVKEMELAKEDIDELFQIAKNMIATAKKYSGIGLAANQVAIMKRMFVFYDPRIQDFRVILNPRIEEVSGMKETYEGCLSIPVFTVLHPVFVVKRPALLKLTFEELLPDKSITFGSEWFSEINVNGEQYDLPSIIMHEIDHLNGILLIDREVSVV